MKKVACIRYNLVRKQPYKPLTIPLPDFVDYTNRDKVDDFCSDFLQDKFGDYSGFYVTTILNTSEKTDGTEVNKC